MTARNEDFLFAQEAQAHGYVTEEQVEEGFLLQRKMSEDLKIDERLSVILVKRGWMADEQAKRVAAVIEPEGRRSRIEGYRLVQMVGRGAMGTVYKAIHKGLHRVVAVKILRRELAADKTQVERLKREAKLLADLDHPNIVRAFDAGESNGFPFLVMEYVEGETLRERINRLGPLPDEEALRITRALADALERARRMGVVHRDIKPGNVLISTSGVPKIMDLGLAKGPIDLALTQHGATVGTPQFISPEQAQDPRKADTRSDIYSLGASLYTMVTGRPPFEGATLAEIITKVLYQQPVPPRMRNPAISPEVGHLIERMMLKDPTLRYQTPREVVDDIDMIRGGQSIVPRGFQGNWEAYLLRQRQRRIARWSIIGGAAALLIGFGAFFVIDRLAREEAEGLVQSKVATVRALPASKPGQTLEELQALQAQAKRLDGEILKLVREKGVFYEGQRGVQTRIDAYEGDIKALKLVKNQGVSVSALLQAGNFAAAHRRMHGVLRTVQGSLPARAAAAKSLAAILKSSDQAFEDVWERHQKRTAGDLAEFAAQWRALVLAFAEPFAEDKSNSARLKDRRERADQLAQASTRILEEVRSVQDRFLGSAVHSRIADLAFFEVDRDLRNARLAARERVRPHAEAFRNIVSRPLLLGPNGYVQVALEAIERKWRGQVEDYWTSEKARLLALTDEAEKIKGLRDWDRALDRGNVFPDILREAGELYASINAEQSKRDHESKVAFAATRGRVLAALRRGDPEGLAQEIKEAPRSLQGEHSGAVDALMTGAEALRTLRDRALAYIAKKGTLNDVKSRAADGGWVVHKRWRDVKVDLERGRIQYRLGGSRSPLVTVPVSDIHLEQLEAWAAAGGQPLDGLLLEIVRFARLQPIGDEPGRDLRPGVKDYEAAQRRFTGLDGAGAWHALTTYLVRQLDGYQRQREQNAEGIIGKLEILSISQKSFEVVKRSKGLMDASGKGRWTRAFELNKPRIERWLAIAERALAQQELLRFVPGADVLKLEGARHRFTFDFDSDIQFDNFIRGLGVLEEYQGVAVTPRGSVNRRLHLLRGMRGLVRDRPLSLPTMFDPFERIVVRFKMNTLAGSFLVGIDIDGVQLAICSADPHYWKWRLSGKAPLLDGEEALPEFDFYGKGRGLAVHWGRDFGPAFPGGNWDWSSRGKDYRYKEWTDQDYLAKQRPRLFAFEPGQTYDVMVARTRGQLVFFVDGDEIARVHKSDWEAVGRRSEKNRHMRGGSGLIQILTWTPMTIDDLSVEGTVMETWRRDQKIALRKKAEEELRKKGK